MNVIAYCCPFVPAEWIMAHGLTPARIIPAAGTSEIRNPKSEIAAYAGVCPFARGFAESAINIEASAEIVVTTACDQMRRIGDWLAERSARPVFLLNVPSTCTPSARGLYASELRRLGGFLEALGGTAPSTEHLAQIMLECEANRGPTSEEVGYPAAESAPRETTLSAPERPTHQLLGPRTKDQGQRTKDHAIPLALIGGPLLAEDFDLFELIAQAGGRVVLDGTEQGERTRPARFERRRLADDPFDELVRAYFETIPDAFRRPDRMLHDWLSREIGARGVRGAILHRYVWCDNWHAEVYRLKETLGVPVLDLDHAGANEGGRARAQARIEAFLEMLR